MYRFYICVLTIIIALFHTNLDAKEQNVTQDKVNFSLKNLKSGDRENIIKNNGRITIAMVYQPDCPWCKKQGLTMASLMSACPEKVNFTLIGNKGDRRQLKRELKHFDRNLPALQADNAFLRSIGGIAASPTTLFYDENGNLLIKRRGYIEPQQFSVAIKQLTRNDCNI